MKHNSMIIGLLSMALLSGPALVSMEDEDDKYLFACNRLGDGLNAFVKKAETWPRKARALIHCSSSIPFKAPPALEEKYGEEFGGDLNHYIYEHLLANPDQLEPFCVAIKYLKQKT